MIPSLPADHPLRDSREEVMHIRLHCQDGCGLVWTVESVEGEIRNVDRACECGRGFGLIVDRWDP